MKQDLSISSLSSRMHDHRANNGKQQSVRPPRKTNPGNSRPSGNNALRTNSGEPRYSCDQCQKYFNKQSSYTRHKYEHSGQNETEFFTHYSLIKYLIAKYIF